MERWLAESAVLAAWVPDEMAPHWQSFCATNVAVWRTSLAVERGEGGGKIAELAGAVDERKLTSRTRRADFLADVGRGVACDPKSPVKAVRWLRRAEDAAPRRIRNSMPARETVAYLLNSARALAGIRNDVRLAPYFDKAVDAFLTVPDPRLNVLRSTPRLFRAIRITLTEPAD
jgi:hypothetical protein